MADSPLTIARLIFAGTSIVLLMYGVYLTLSVLCIHYLITSRRQNRIVLAYTVLSLLVTTIFLAASAKYTELIFLENAAASPSLAKLLSRLELLQQVAYSVKIWLADSLLIYRLWVVWIGCFTICILPSVLFIGSLTSGIAGLALFGRTDVQQQIVNLGVGFHSCSVALNIGVTLLIAGKLLHHRRQVKSIRDDSQQEYLSLSAVFAESCAIYSITGLVYIPLYARHSSLIYVFAALLEAASGIGPSIILLRIALGVAVTKESREVSTLKFGSQHHARTESTLAGPVWLNRSSEERSSHIYPAPKEPISFAENKITEEIELGNTSNKDQ